MRRPDAPITQDLLLIGGGHAHALALRTWAMRPLPGARLTLVNPEPTAPYTGMLPGLVAGHYQRRDLEIDLVRLARWAGARLILDRVVGLDRAAGRALLAGRPPVAYDVASINVGVTSEATAPALAAHATPAKPLGPFADAWAAFTARVAAGAAPPEAAVVGGGVGGVELAMAMAHRLTVLSGGPARVTVIEAADTLLPAATPALRERLAARLEALGVSVRLGAAATAADAASVTLADGSTAPSAFTAMAAGARPQPWLAETGLALRDGFVRVGPTLQAVNDPRIFAVGDAAFLEHGPREKAGVFAVREGPILADNLARALSGRRPWRFTPQGDYLKLISTGAQAAVAEKWGLARWSPLFWRWKDRIDRAFMAKLEPKSAPGTAPETAPEPDGPEATGVRAVRAGDPLCGGCGSKVGPAALSAGLSALPAPRRADVGRAPGDDAASLNVGETRLAFSADQFRAFIDDPYELGRIAALHALSDVWARGAAPQAALALVTLAPMSPAKQAETLAEILAGADAALGPAGADLAGGHTALGVETSVGFAVTGLGDARDVGLAGARPGDALLLTKPLGVGVILAAEMRGLADGRDWAAAMAMMRRSNGPAAAALAPVATAMTDVTGFGLAGHLLSLLARSAAAAEIRLDAIPRLPGAAALAATGVASSAFPENARARERTDLDAAALSDPRAALLFDPQTSGGLLAAVPEDQADAALAALGADAARIGRIVAPEPGGPALRVIRDGPRR